MNNSVFSKIARGELPAEIIYQDDQFMVILSIAPHNPGHSLVFPKQATTGDFCEMPASQLTDMTVLAQKIAKVIKSELSPTRVGLVFEGFGVPDHVHINLIPINKPGDLDHDMAKPATPDELAVVGKKLRYAVEKQGV